MAALCLFFLTISIAQTHSVLTKYQTHELISQTNSKDQRSVSYSAAAITENTKDDTKIRQGPPLIPETQTDIPKYQITHGYSMIPPQETYIEALPSRQYNYMDLGYLAHNDRPIILREPPMRVLTPLTLPHISAKEDRAQLKREHVYTRQQIQTAQPRKSAQKKHDTTDGTHKEWQQWQYRQIQPNILDIVWVMYHTHNRTSNSIMSPLMT